MEDPEGTEGTRVPGCQFERGAGGLERFFRPGNREGKRELAPGPCHIRLGFDQVAYRVFRQVAGSIAIPIDPEAVQG